MENESRQHDAERTAEQGSGCVEHGPHEAATDQLATTASGNANPGPSHAKHGDDFFLTCHLHCGGRDYAAILWGRQDAAQEGDAAMTANLSFHFGEYLLRPASLDDMALAVKWTAADAERPEFWIEQTAGRDSYMLEDQEGPVFFFKMHRLSLKAVEIHTQFPPLGTVLHSSEKQEHDRRRVQQAIIQGFRWLEGSLAKTKVKEIYFDSTHPPLRAFAVRRLGFATSQGPRLLKSIGGT